MQSTHEINSPFSAIGPFIKSLKVLNSFVEVPGPSRRHYS